MPEGESPGLDEQLLYTRNTECNFPNGCHVAEVEVDAETGQVEVVRYAAVDDVGNVINPMLVHGQSHGGIVAGIGQALLEHAVYDPESGQFLTATFQDYCMPRASDAPSFDLGFNVVPCPNNDLGVKGAGEGGACGAPPAVVSAVCDALGVTHVDMPLTPERVWRAMARGVSQRFLPAVFMRGGSSKGVFFHARDLPAERAAVDRILLAVLGSPDPYGRQLDGMGGGISSLSKAVIIGPPTHPEADVDYTFAQVAVDRPVVDWRDNCGNLSSAVGPFAVDEGLVRVEDGEALVRIHQVNTRKLIHARFPVRDGRAEIRGEFAIAGVAGTGARIRLDFLAPGGAQTGALLPTGRAVDQSGNRRLRAAARDAGGRGQSGRLRGRI